VPSPEHAIGAVLHAGLIALYDRGAWKGVLIQGPSGVGKSDLALRALQIGFRLVADDRTRLWVSQGRLFGACPAPIAGLIEARGVGILPHPARPLAEIRLVARCLGAQEPVERLPDRVYQTLLDIEVPALDLRPLEASAPQKLHRALSLLGATR
jgi:serine kinase of HPr protein (carbohydrate metabolism regulator)